MISLTVLQKRMLKAEVAVSTVINAVIIPVLLWLSPVPPPAEIAGPDGLALSLVKGTVIPVFLMTTLITLVLRKRLAKAGVERIDPATTSLGWLGAIPRLAPLRAIVFAVMALCSIMPVSLGVAVLLKTYPLNDATFFAFNVVYGIVIAVAVTPFIVLAAMLEPRQAAAVPAG